MPVCHGDTNFRHVLLEEVLGARDVLDTRTDVKTLAAAIVFAQQRLAHSQRVEWRNERANRQPVDRSRRNDREFAHAGERELKGARDRRRGQGQNMDLGSQRLEAFLVGDPEMLFLVDNQKPEVLEFDGLTKQCMRSDHDVERAIGEPSS